MHNLLKSDLKTVLTCITFIFTASLTFAEDPNQPLFSTTGPTPPIEVIQQDLMKMVTAFDYQIAEESTEVIINNVPSYDWRHGCGPTALGMVIGYYDGLGFEDLIPGSADTQTSQVDQVIASGGDSSNPFPPGSEQHYEDYASPEDDDTTLTDDDYITAARTPHNDNCIADFMDTSKSTRDLKYGWSYNTDMGPAFIDYVNMIDPNYNPSYNRLKMSDNSLNWTVLTNEIDNARPMVFLVDTDADGSTDHFVTVIGYRDSPTQQYACRDTWYSTIRWADFAEISSGQSWGVSEGFKLQLSGYPPIDCPDFTGDYHVDLEDLAYFASQWQKNYPLPYMGADISGDMTVDYNDLNNIITNWLENCQGIFFFELLDTDPGWTTQGLWQFGTPAGLGGDEHGSPDPASGKTGNNVYGYNLNGDYENSLSEKNLTTNAIDCTGKTNVHLRFYRWLNVETSLYDNAYVKISTNGTTWTTLWHNPGLTGNDHTTDYSWQLIEYDISAIADNQSTVYIRWTMGTTDSTWQLSGWNIDDIVLYEKNN